MILSQEQKIRAIVNCLAGRSHTLAGLVPDVNAFYKRTSPDKEVSAVIGKPVHILGHMIHEEEFFYNPKEPSIEHASNNNNGYIRLFRQGDQVTILGPPEYFVPDESTIAFTFPVIDEIDFLKPLTERDGFLQHAQHLQGRYDLDAVAERLYTTIFK